jgi:type II secretory pathway pseudopilin PulG
MHIPGNGSLGRSRGLSGGFTLLEVLIGVLVLALALLGLAAMFPVVVRTQRIARDAVVGTGIVEAAEATVRNHEFFTSGDPSRGLPWYAGQLRRAPDDIQSKWQVSLDLNVNSRRLYRVDNGRADGSLQFGTSNVRLRAADRLNLPSYVQGSTTEPTLVWDLAMCLEEEKPIVADPDGNASPPSPSVRIAIFVRRLDSAIRVTPNNTLIQDLIAARRVPIGSDQTTFGNPTLSGTGSHSVPMYVNVTEARQSSRGGAYNILQLEVQDAASPASQRDKILVQSLGLPGQILVDNLGGVHTVLRNVRRVNGTTVYNEVLLERGLSEKAVRLANDNNLPLQVALTPQVPVAVRVMTVRP